MNSEEREFLSRQAREHFRMYKFYQKKLSGRFFGDFSLKWYTVGCVVCSVVTALLYYWLT